MTLPEARQLLADAGQSRVLAFWDRLDGGARARLLEQISSIDWPSVARLRGVLARGAQDAPAAPLEPAPVVELAGAARAAAAARGEAELRAGRVAALLVAGGQGSRLGFDGPKGCCPVGPVSDEPLFFFHARKILALARRFGRPVPLYVMTSAANDAATRAFFASRGFFGLAEEDVFFFSQGMWPALDAEGRVLLDEPGRVFLSPDGHGGVLAALARSGALDDMEARGIASVCYFQVDNPMVDVADPAFVGLHVSEDADWTLKVCRRTGPGEKMGMPVLRGGRAAIVEYTEFSEEDRRALGPDGSLRFAWGSPALHVFSVPFLRREAEAGLPVHLAHKKVPFVDDSGVLVKPESPNAWKFEKFVFDALADARKSVCLAFDREEEYAPVKNAEGDKSPAACRADLSRKWARWLRAAGVAVPLGTDGRPSRRVEIDPAFADSPAALAARDLFGVDPSGDILLRADAAIA
jgi:UDP-N-acetylglucosamine/UDP-N-acetylgalactosamine diphosphorylase